MMSAIRKLRPVSVAEYLAMEKISDSRHELVDGYRVAMDGSSQRHDLIAGNLFTLLRAALHGTPCQVFMFDSKVRVGDNLYYPDLTVSCHVENLSNGTVPKPVLIAEVLSVFTEGRDRHEKLIAYQRLESLREIVLVTELWPRVEVYRRQPDGWEVETYYSTRSTVNIGVLGLAIDMAAIYEITS